MRNNNNNVDNVIDPTVGWASEYDMRCALEFARLELQVDRFFVELKTECPYSKPFTARFYQAIFGPLTDRAMELFLSAGYRRNGNCLYTMHCHECQECIPIRLRPEKFVPNRNQRRVAKKNQDLEIGYTRVQMDKENLQLCQDFLQQRYPHEYNNADGYYGGFFCNSIIDSMRVEFRHEGRLIGGSIIDIGENWMNAVYFYFDPKEARRSLGTFNVLTLLHLCREMNIGYLYLGYYIPEVSAMSYKNRFKPHELHLNGRWQEVEE